MRNRVGPDRTEIIRKVESLFTSDSQVNATTSILTTLRLKLIPANTFKFRDHIRYEGGGFILAIGGNVTLVEFLLTFGGITVHNFTFVPPAPAPGPYPWWMQGIITQNADIGGMLVIQDNPVIINLTRGELPGWPGPGANMDLLLQARLTISAGTGLVASETWNVVKIPGSN